MERNLEMLSSDTAWPHQFILWPQLGQNLASESTGFPHSGQNFFDASALLAGWSPSGAGMPGVGAGGRADVPDFG